MVKRRIRTKDQLPRAETRQEKVDKRRAELERKQKSLLEQAYVPATPASRSMEAAYFGYDAASGEDATAVAVRWWGDWDFRKRHDG